MPTHVMQLEIGLFDHMVLQRTRTNGCDAVFAGQCRANGEIRATVRRGKVVVRKLANVKAGRVTRGRMQGFLRSVPTGGPYDIELRVGDVTHVVRDVLVGDVWLLGGQSNMQGCGVLPKPRLSRDPQVRAFYMDDRWDVAQDPIHNMWACVDAVHVDLCGGRPGKPDADFGACPGPMFGQELRRLTGVPQGLIACAHGGTSMTHWDPTRRDEGGKSLYGALVRRLRKNGGRVAGMIWYQGESDAGVAAAPLYTARMQKLIAALRRDAQDRSLPVAIVQIARVLGAWWTEPAAVWNSIQEQQRLLPSRIANLTVVPAIDLPLDDGIHIGGQGHLVLGRRLAQAMRVLRVGRRAGWPPIALQKITLETERGAAVVVAEFANVATRLTAGSRPSGFALATAQGLFHPFDVVLDGPRARIRTGLPMSDMAVASFHYGYGMDPYCNIVDSAGRSLPVFGPVPVCHPRAISPHIRSLRVSAFQPSAGRLDTLDCPERLDALQMTPRTFGDPFCNLHAEIMQCNGQDAVVFYACRFACAEEMRLALLLGYDGPVKAWVDGNVLLHDPDGTNPASSEKRIGRFRAAAGEHELIVALGTNHGAAWGIFLQIERLGVPRKLILKGPEHYRLPVLLG
ncbi:MAG: sialate O-acetylesterase [Kiritimatiellia bacterium]